MIRNPIPGNTLTPDEADEHHHYMSNKLYVGNLSFNTTESGLRDAFGQFGSVTDVHLPTDRDTGRPRGFAFATLGTADEGKLAAEKMNGADLDGRTLTVNEARPKEEMGGGRNFAPARKAGAFHSRYNGRR